MFECTLVLHQRYIIGIGLTLIKSASECTTISWWRHIVWALVFTTSKHFTLSLFTWSHSLHDHFGIWYQSLVELQAITGLLSSVMLYSHIMLLLMHLTNFYALITPHYFTIYSKFPVCSNKKVKHLCTVKANLVCQNLNNFFIPKYHQNILE